MGKKKISLYAKKDKENKITCSSK